jgi:adenylate kinase family enzyme
MPDAQFLGVVSEFVEQVGWVVDGNYFSIVTGPAVWPVADTVIWIDPPRAAVLRQVVWRTIRRGACRTTLWNGNRESLRNAIRWDPYKSVIRWSWTSYEGVRQRYETAMNDPTWQHLTFVRLRSSREMRRFVEKALEL